VIRYRPITAEDGRRIFDVFYDAIADVDRRLGDPDAWDPGDDAMRASAWAAWQPLYDHLAATSDLGWLAEDDGVTVGYARSIRRERARELTEFFVRPGRQGDGIGRDLLARAFAPEPGVHRTIIATLELPALSRYLATGLGVRTMAARLARAPTAEGTLDPADRGLVAAPMTRDAAEVERVEGLDAATLGHRRQEEHAWLESVRDGFSYRRAGRLVGYGYVPRGTAPFPTSFGPILALDPADLPAMLGHAERLAVARGLDEVAFWVPLSNTAATQYLLGRRYRIDRFMAAVFADEPLPGLERYVLHSPPFFL
jgi:GNAT superfamily N-acetyltransferase